MRKEFQIKSFLRLLAAGRLIKDGGNRLLWAVDTAGATLFFKIFFSDGRPYLAPSPDNNRWELINFVSENIFLLDKFLDPAFRDWEEYMLACKIAQENEQMKYISFSD
jgi:hypothetical protein